MNILLQEWESIDKINENDNKDDLMDLLINKNKLKLEQLQRIAIV